LKDHSRSSLDIKKALGIRKLSKHPTGDAIAPKAVANPLYIFND